MRYSDKESVKKSRSLPENPLDKGSFDVLIVLSRIMKKNEKWRSHFFLSSGSFSKVLFSQSRRFESRAKWRNKERSGWGKKLPLKEAKKRLFNGEKVSINDADKLMEPQENKSN